MRRVPETEVAVLAATNSCGQVVERSFSETLPTGDWGYRLEVFDHSGAVGCRVDVELE